MGCLTWFPNLAQQALVGPICYLNFLGWHVAKKIPFLSEHGLG